MSGQDFVAIVVLRTILHGLSPLWNKTYELYKGIHE